MKKALVLSNMGGARSPEELKLFLKNMFRDKRIIPGKIRHLISAILPEYRYKKVWKDYEKIGGSRIYSLTESLIEKMKKDRERDILLSMRYTRPYLQEVIDGYDEIIVLPMYPHFSSTTSGSVWDEIEELDFKGKIRVIPEFYKNPDFNTLIIDSIYKEIPNPEEYHLIFSAHGLPEYITKQGDPYIKQVYEHVEILKKSLTNFRSVEVGFQSRIGPVKWQKPYLEEVLQKHTNKNVVVYPISFLIDNSETDFELKIEYAQIANEYGVKNYKVIECLNDLDRFATFLNQLTEKYI